MLHYRCQNVMHILLLSALPVNYYSINASARSTKNIHNNLLNNKILKTDPQRSTKHWCSPKCKWFPENSFPDISRTFGQFADIFPRAVKFPGLFWIFQTSAHPLLKETQSIDPHLEEPSIDLIPSLSTTGHLSTAVLLLALWHQCHLVDSRRWQLSLCYLLEKLFGVIGGRVKLLWSKLHSVSQHDGHVDVWIAT